MALPPPGAGVNLIRANLALPSSGSTGLPTVQVQDSTKSISELLSVLTLQKDSFELPSMITPHEIYTKYIGNSKNFIKYLNNNNSDSTSTATSTVTSTATATNKDKETKETTTNGTYKLDSSYVIPQLDPTIPRTQITRVNDIKDDNAIEIIKKIKDLWRGTKKEQVLNTEANKAIVTFWNNNIKEFNTTNFVNYILGEVNK